MVSLRTVRTPLVVVTWRSFTSRCMKRCRMSNRLFACKHLVPEVMGLPVALHRRIARPVVVAPVEGQEMGLLAPEAGRHPDLVRVHGEVDQGALLEGEEQIALVPLRLVLLYRIGGALPGERVLQLAGDDGDAVDGQGHVDDAAAVLPIRPLSSPR